MTHLESPYLELRQTFFSLKTAHDVASMLKTDYKRMVHLTYALKPGYRYTTFTVPKKSGDTRKISAPIEGLKTLQSKLAGVLKTVYKPSASTQGFVPGRSIISNAEHHLRQRHVLNIDIADFFPSINFGRVRGMFMSYYNIPAAPATVLAQICCFKNQLPQGSPTSPVVSNMICQRLDKELEQLAKWQGCTYTRYADDMTFSTSEYAFPSVLARVVPQDSGSRVKLGEELIDIIEDNGFDINKEKTRLQQVNERQIVTGILVNRKLNVRREYIRQIRAMLYAWRKFGLEAAEREFQEKYDKKYRMAYKEYSFLDDETFDEYVKVHFKDVVRGKIEFLGSVRGKDDEIYNRYWNQLADLDPEFSSRKTLPSDSVEGSLSPLIRTEGKTDVKHLKAALSWFKSRGKYQRLKLQFEEEENRGDQELFRLLKASVKIGSPSLSIFIFDRDNKNIVRDVTERDSRFRRWNENVYSLALPVPSHRQETPDICIELVYKNEDLLQHDVDGRRIFLSSEFDKRSSRHKEDGDLSCRNRNIFKWPQPRIVSDEVFNQEHENVALSKNDFADNVLNSAPNFEDIDFSEFAAVFDLLSQIVEESAASHSSQAKD